MVYMIYHKWDIGWRIYGVIFILKAGHSSERSFWKKGRVNGFPVAFAQKQWDQRKQKSKHNNKDW